MNVQVSAANDAEFTRPSNEKGEGAYPQVRVVALAETRSRALQEVRAGVSRPVCRALGTGDRDRGGGNPAARRPGGGAALQEPRHGLPGGVRPALRLPGDPPPDRYRRRDRPDRPGPDLLHSRRASRPPPCQRRGGAFPSALADLVDDVIYEITHPRHLLPATRRKRSFRREQRRSGRRFPRQCDPVKKPLPPRTQIMFWLLQQRHPAAETGSRSAPEALDDLPPRNTPAHEFGQAA
jgi:hypothetical protein